MAVLHLSIHLSRRGGRLHLFVSAYLSRRAVFHLYIYVSRCGGRTYIYPSICFAARCSCVGSSTSHHVISLASPRLVSCRRVSTYLLCLPMSSPRTNDCRTDRQSESAATMITFSPWYCVSSLLISCGHEVSHPADGRWSVWKTSNITCSKVV